MNPRLLFLLGLAASWFLAIGVRLYQVQVVRHDYYQQRAERQQNRVVTLTPPRGTIYDRRGQELAVSVEVRSVAADPTQVTDPENAARELGRLLGLDAKKLTGELASDRGFVWVARKIDPPLSEAVEALDLPGVFTLPENKRYYPLRTLASQVIGFVGTDNEGLAGLEYLYEPVVAPEPGKRTVVRDARFGTVLYPHFVSSAGRPGQDLVLTLDATIQHVVELELLRAIRQSKAVRGKVVVMDPRTGAVLAMASYPTFDPNRFRDFPKESWRNPAVQDVDEPGSTFKLVTVAAALEAGAVDAADQFHCEMGGIRFGKTLIKDHSRFGVLTVREIMAKSSNVGAIKLAQAAGRRRFYKTIQAFGFGTTSGIDLPSESPGLLRSLESWSPLSPAYHSFGQGLSVTAIQLTNAFAAIANGGHLLRPFVVRHMGHPGDPRYKEQGREVVGLPISPSSVSEIRSMLESVVLAGTAKTAAIPGYRAAGKTGTAQKAVPGGGYSATRHIASFVGFAPVHDPALVITVILDEPRPRYHGGEVAAPVFRAIAEKALLYLGVAPETRQSPDWPGEYRETPRVDLAHRLEDENLSATLRAEMLRAETPAGTVPDFAGLSARQAFTESSRVGLRLALDGHGAVVRQTPAPGTPLEETDGKVRLWLTRRTGA